MRDHRIRVFLLWFLPVFAHAAEEVSPIEQVAGERHRHGEALGTRKYAPSKAERPFFEKLDKGQVQSGGLAGPYNIVEQQGKYVGWFGIVRGVTEDIANRTTTLAVEHKYFDGLTDLHIQAVSFNGSGDFVAILHGVDLEIEPLSLVKVYGVVAPNGDSGPRVQAVFVRNWLWGSFTFLMAAGNQRGSEQWRKLNTVPLDDIYDPHPNSDYYIERLGPLPPEVLEQRDARFLRKAGPMSPRVEAAMKFLVKNMRENSRKMVFASGFAPYCRSVQELGGDQAAAVIFVAMLLSPHHESESNEIRMLLQQFPKAAVTELTKALDDRRPSHRLVAADALGTLKEHARPSIPILLRRLQDRDDKESQQFVIRALSNIGDASEPVVEGLRSLLNDPDAEIRIVAARSLIQLRSDDGTAIALLGLELKSDVVSNRQQALGALLFLPGRLEPLVSPVIAALRDDDTIVRRTAAEVLGQIGATTSVAALAEALHDSDSHVAKSAAMALGQIGPDAEPAIPQLIEACAAQDYFMRQKAVEALGQVGCRPDECLPVLIRLLSDRSDHVVTTVTRTLLSFPGRNQESTPELLMLLRSKRSEHVRFSAAMALGRISTSDDTIDALINTLGDQSNTMRRFAASALGEAGKGVVRVKAALSNALSKEQESARIEIAGALVQSGGDPEEPLHLLSDILHNSTKSMEKMWILHQVIKIGPAAGPLIPDLIPLLKSEDRSDRRDAARAIGRIGEAAISAVPDLKEMLSDSITGNRAYAAQALWRITRYPESVGILQRALQDPDEFAAATAAQALEEIGPDAIATVPALEAALHEGTFRVRHAARAAMPKITGKPTDNTSNPLIEIAE